MCDTGALPIHFCLSNQDQAILEQVQGSPWVDEELHRKNQTLIQLEFRASNNVSSVIVSVSLALQSKERNLLLRSP